jgi:hypothetical protein
MLSGHQADPGGELPPVLELACIPDGGDYKDFLFAAMVTKEGLTASL